MSFDTMTIVGLLSALLSGGFLIALVSCNRPDGCRGRPAGDGRRG